MVRHALALEDKEARRDLILGAALTLFLEDTRRLPTAASIAAKAGLAKGTVYLYFDTKEQIFAALLSREWRELLSQVGQSFAKSGGADTARVASFIDHFASFLDSHPYFLRLDALGYALLEGNLPPDQFWEFKRPFSEAIERAADIVDAELALPLGRGLELLTRSYALARGLWQMTDFPDHARADTRHGVHPFSRSQFDHDLRSALEEYWRGALVTGS